MFDDCYQGKRVLITGHTGFKGSWLGVWLQRLGAELCGVGLPMETPYSHYGLLNPCWQSHLCDIRDHDSLLHVFRDFQPEIVFHLAARPLVRQSYREPVDTFAVNVVGTANVLDACRLTESVRSVVVITSDKCYENRETMRPYRETDPMGGYDPYSASKGCAELVAASFRRSFFHPDSYDRTHHVLLATARAGNVIGGGDWAADRLVPDLIRAASEDRTELIRCPSAVRPWQHVLEPLSGYLTLGQHLYAGRREFARGWNFGPDSGSAITVGEAAAGLARYWPRIRFQTQVQHDAPHEAGLLCLDCSDAAQYLHWHGVWSAGETFARTAAWYRDFYELHRMNTENDLSAYIADARKRNLSWIK